MHGVVPVLLIFLCVIAVLHATVILGNFSVVGENNFLISQSQMTFLGYFSPSGHGKIIHSLHQQDLVVKIDKFSIKCNSILCLRTVKIYVNITLKAIGYKNPAICI